MVGQRQGGRVRGFPVLVGPSSPCQASTGGSKTERWQGAVAGGGYRVAYVKLRC